MKKWYHNRMALWTAIFLRSLFDLYHATHFIWTLKLFDKLLPTYRRHFFAALGRESGVQTSTEYLRDEISRQTHNRGSGTPHL